MRLSLFLFFIIIPFFAFSQFPPPVGQAGSTAIHVDSANWLGWATSCQVERGLKKIDDPTLGYVNAGAETNATGAADGSIISLGDKGQATLSFDYPIKDGLGPDFVIFENAFNNTFLELAFVEVSSDGQNFVRFPAISNSDTSTQIGSFGSVDATKIHNLAGKYKASYGTPFDLADLQDSSTVDIQNITHIRLIDVIGTIDSNYAQLDSRGIPVNDPYPTPFASGGFDLDGVGVLYFNYQSSAFSHPQNKPIKVYPNPAQREINIDFSDLNIQGNMPVRIYNLNGQLVYETLNIREDMTIVVEDWARGIYLLKAGNYQTKIIID